MGIIVGDIQGIDDDENIKTYDNEEENENYEFMYEDIYDKMLKSMTKYNLQYDKFNHNIIKENFENINTKQNITYIASSPIPIPYSNKKTK